jgi:hypothetical protein
MLKHLGKIKFIGDLSLEDADILAKYGKQSVNILEFGVGGSSQVLSQCLPEKLICVDTIETGGDVWINVTRKRINTLANKTVPDFFDLFDFFKNPPKINFDLIFVDGVWWQRQPFADFSWSLLNAGGVMIFHDTRRNYDFESAADIAKKYFQEIKLIEVNAESSNGKSSNMTVLHKKICEPYVNWQETENKPKWAYGDPGYDGELLSWQ